MPGFVDKLKVEEEQRFLSSDGEVAEAERELGIRFPAGYAELVTNFGEGWLGGWLRIYPPRRILHGPYGQDDWLERIRKYWFWDRGALTKTEALDSVVIGDSAEGDEIICNRTRKQSVFILPRHDEESYEISGSMDEIIHFFFESGILVEPFEDWTFEPFSTERHVKK